MFSNCKTITELNQKRAELISGGKLPAIDVNNAYNTARKSLLTTQRSRLTKIVPKDITFPKVFTIPIHYGTEPNTIRLTEKGFFI